MMARFSLLQQEEDDFDAQVHDLFSAGKISNCGCYTCIHDLAHRSIT